MTPRQIDLVQSTFAAVVPIADTAATVFYDDVFTRDPSLRPLFAEDLSEQKVTLMKMLGTAVNALTDWASVAPAVAQLGARHAGYGVSVVDYDTVGAALIATLATGLGDAFDDEVRAAWTACYGIVAETMIGAQSLSA